MNTDIYELGAKALIGENLNDDDEQKKLKAYTTKYELVRYLIIEKQRHMGIDLKNFHFTPGDEFLDMPALDVANSIVNSFSGIFKPHTFGDSHRPPESGIEAVELDD